MNNNKPSSAPRVVRTAPAAGPWSLLLPIVLMVASLGAATWSIGQTLVLRQTLSEGRTVADMVENIGRWASQYGGVHAKTTGADAKIPGNFLTRAVYTTSAADGAVLQGALATASAEQSALMRVEAYHWKNPALIQREVADVVAASGSKARYRLTARTVLNQNNAPDAFEREALDAVALAAERGDGKAPEYWKVQGGTLLYARSVAAQQSCLRCHDKAENAPEFLKTNAQFNGGGGFGYVAGKPAGLISVKVPMADPVDAVVASAPREAWAALGVAVLAVLWLFAVALRRRRG